MINWDDFRQEFPVTEKCAYLNTAAAGPLSRSVMQAGTEYYRQMMADGDVHWDEWREQVEVVRNQVAKFINAEPDEVALTTNTSSGMNIIIDALEGRGEVISCDLEFPVSTITWMHRRIPVHLVKSTAGELLVDDIRSAMTGKTGIVSISHVQFSNGFRIDLNELGNNKGDHALVVNASQSSGVFEIDVKRMGIDALCTTGHKWMLSGYGSGFVYMSRKLLAETKSRSIGWLSVNDPYAMRNAEIHLRHDASARVELGCSHFAGMFALGASVSFFNSIGITSIEERALSLNKFLTDCLTEGGWNVLSPLSTDGCRSAETLVGVANPQAVVATLAQQDVIVTEKREGIRVATDFFNNQDDIERLLRALEKTRQ